MTKKAATTAAAAAAVIFGIIVASRGATEHIPAPPDYADTTMWFTALSDTAGTGADIFYLVSTWEKDWLTPSDSLPCHYADVWNPIHRQHMADEISRIAAYMGPGNNFYAPYYRHTTIEAFVTQNEDTVNQRMQLPLDDVRAAFHHFLLHRDPSRPFILAGFSQGAIAVIGLLKDMDDQTYSQLAAAYVMGWEITPHDTLQTTHIKAAKGESDTGVTNPASSWSAATAAPSTDLIAASSTPATSTVASPGSTASALPATSPSALKSGEAISNRPLTVV